MLQDSERGFVKTCNVYLSFDLSCKKYRYFLIINLYVLIPILFVIIIIALQITVS